LIGHGKDISIVAPVASGEIKRKGGDGRETTEIRRMKEAQEQFKSAMIFMNKVQLMPIVTDKGMVKRELASRIHSN
jgi:hypothetical protein